MALVSVKNFVTPLTNRVHVGTIVALVAIFAVFRAAGGAMSLTGPHERSPVERAIQAESLKKAIAQPQKRIVEDLPDSMDDLDPAQELNKLGIDAEPAQPRRTTKAPRESGDLVDSMLNKKQNPKNAQGAKDQGDLDEIERRLGLR